MFGTAQTLYDRLPFFKHMVSWQSLILEGHVWRALNLPLKLWRKN